LTITGTGNTTIASSLGTTLTVNGAVNAGGGGITKGIEK